MITFVWRYGSAYGLPIILYHQDHQRTIMYNPPTSLTAVRTVPEPYLESNLYVNEMTSVNAPLVQVHLYPRIYAHICGLYPSETLLHRKSRINRDVSEIYYCLKNEFPFEEGNILTLRPAKWFLSNHPLIRKNSILWPNYHVAPIYLNETPLIYQRPAAPSVPSEISAHTDTRPLTTLCEIPFWINH